jgi:hypothetical protein
VLGYANIFGPGCQRCTATTQLVQTGSDKLNVSVTIGKVTYQDRLNAESRHRRQSGVPGRALPRKASNDTWWLKMGSILGGLRWDRCLSTASASVESDEDDRCLDLASGVRLFGTIFNTAVVATSPKA